MICKCGQPIERCICCDASSTDLSLDDLRTGIEYARRHGFDAPMVVSGVPEVLSDPNDD